MTTRGTIDLPEALKSMTAGNPELERELNTGLSDTRLVRCLIGMRARAGLSQSDLAKKMGCSQSRISKIEHGKDGRITIEELVAYSKATGFWLEINFSNCKQNAAGMVKHHILLANMLLNNIITLAEKDESMQKGVDKLSIELLLNFCQLLDQQTRKIPNSTFQKLLKTAAGKRKPRTLELNCAMEPEAEIAPA